MDGENKSKLIPNEEEVEKLRKDILFDLNKTKKEIRKEKRKKIIYILSITILIIAFIKIVFGTIYIPNALKYPFNKTRFYKVTLNDELISSEYFLTQKLPIIPYLVYLKSEYFDGYLVEGDTDNITYNGDGLDKFIINIDSYSCYYKGHQTKCKDEKQNMKKNNDTKYTRLVINRTTKPAETIYDGEFINDLTPYIKDKGNGIYVVTIYANYSFIETEIDFDIAIGRNK